jgi:hypothetical protein
MGGNYSFMLRCPLPRQPATVSVPRRGGSVVPTKFRRLLLLTFGGQKDREADSSLYDLALSIVRQCPYPIP